MTTLREKVKQNRDISSITYTHPISQTGAVWSNIDIVQSKDKTSPLHGLS